MTATGDILERYEQVIFPAAKPYHESAAGREPCQGSVCLGCGWTALS